MLQRNICLSELPTGGRASISIEIVVRQFRIDPPRKHGMASEHFAGRQVNISVAVRRNHARNQTKVRIQRLYLLLGLIDVRMKGTFVAAPNRLPSDWIDVEIAHMAG